MRSELTPTQKAEHLAKRKELWEARDNAKTFRETPGRPKGFASDTAEKVGITTRSVQQSIARAQKLSPEVRDMIRGTEMDKGTVLDQLAGEPRRREVDNVYFADFHFIQRMVSFHSDGTLTVVIAAAKMDEFWR